MTIEEDILRLKRRFDHSGSEANTLTIGDGLDILNILNKINDEIEYTKRLRLGRHA